jgi:hypothetical protein
LATLGALAAAKRKKIRLQCGPSWYGHIMVNQNTKFNNMSIDTEKQNKSKHRPKHVGQCNKTKTNSWNQIHK